MATKIRPAKLRSDYYAALEEALAAKERALLRTHPTQYVEDCLDALHFITTVLKMHVIFITFDINTRDIAETLQEQGGTLSRVYMIDAMSIISGKGTPPVSRLITVYRPDNFTDIEVYTRVFLKKVDFSNVCVFFNSLFNLEQYQNWNEVGVFLRVFGEFLERYEVPQVAILHDQVDFVEDMIISRNAQRIIYMRQ